MSRLLNRLRAQAAALRASRRGSIPLLFGLSLIPLIGMIGLAVDYGIATTNKTKLDLAADAAAIAAVVTAKAYISDNAGQTNVSANALAAGSAKAINAFNVNTGSITFGQVTLATPQVTRTAQTLTAVVSYSATVKNTFGPIFGSPTTVLSNSVTASADVAGYLDFYLMVDVSGSMGLPSTPSAMNDLAKLNFDMFSDYKQGCQFACHFPATRDMPASKGWSTAVQYKIPLRSDAVNAAVCSLIQRASTPVVPNQYRIGIYPFINQLATLVGMTSSIASLRTAAQCASNPPLAFTNLLDTGVTQLSVNGDPSTGTGSGGTHFETAMPTMKATITSFGDGSSALTPKPFVFLVTDGMQNSQYFYNIDKGRNDYTGYPSKFNGYASSNWSAGGSKPAAMDPSSCEKLKSSGAIVSVLYIPYNLIAFEDKGGGIAYENNVVNRLSPDLATPLRTCASPGFFYTANAPADITASLNAMFDQALRVARLTQ
ncbi:pilus assembly protein TadG-related protein [Methylobacterium sp. J-090]|uniref:pilus assembly protein TadG-related protein n=1 Tax=Methylobacterium sp. J-090 TaxID=2836666 RepID=UPI001FB88D12|nr:pilus assembly protein TadG-related protein [Methylobacterium sp. J-090]MCJ2084073.1 pilus assembly protein TadG-related protein [Methylobacterium sp. J-090]